MITIMIPPPTMVTIFYSCLRSHTVYIVQPDRTRPLAISCTTMRFGFNPEKKYEYEISGYLYKNKVNIIHLTEPSDNLLLRFIFFFFCFLFFKHLHYSSTNQGSPKDRHTTSASCLFEVSSHTVPHAPL